MLLGNDGLVTQRDYTMIDFSNEAEPPMIIRNFRKAMGWGLGAGGWGLGAG